MPTTYASQFYREQDTSAPTLPPPAFRKLRGYAFDPSLSLKLETAAINHTVFQVPWENLKPGPCGEYLAARQHAPLALAGVWRPPCWAPCGGHGGRDGEPLWDPEAAARRRAIVRLTLYGRLAQGRRRAGPSPEGHAR